jgi:hypothetical protein
MLEDEVALDARLACHMITAASRAGDLRLARAVYGHALPALRDPNAPAPHPAVPGRRGPRRGRGGGGGDDSSVLSVEVVNALLGAHATNGDYAGALRVYAREVVARAPGIAPDAFTFSSLLAVAGRAAGPRGLALAVVEGARDAMDGAGVAYNVQVVSALINAYRRVRGGAPLRSGEERLAAAGARRAASAAAAAAHVGGRLHPDVAAAVARARDALDALRARRLANDQCFAVMGAFLLEQGAPDAARGLLRDAAADGVTLGHKALDVLARAAEDGGAVELSIALRASADARAAAAGRGGGGPRAPGASRSGMPAGYSVRPGQR